MRVETNRGDEMIVHNLLHHLATTNRLEDQVEAIFSTAHNAAGVSGSCFVWFENANQRLHHGTGAHWRPADSALRQSVTTASERLTVNPPGLSAGAVPFVTIVAAPVRINADDDVSGGVWFLYDSGTEPDEQRRMTLNLLVDSLTIALRQAQGQRHPERTPRSFSTALTEGILDPLIILDEQRHILMLNTLAETLLNLERQQVIGRPFRDAVPVAPLVELVENSQPLVEWETDDGQVYAPRLQAVRSDDDSEVGWVLALRDITRYKKLNSNQNQFLRIVSHDLRSPLTSMQGFGSMLESGMVGDLNEKQLYFIEKILAGITQIAALVDNIQDAGRFDPETGFYEMERTHCDLGEIVRQIVEGQLVPAGKQLRIDVQVDSNVPIINADHNMLQRAVTNLVDNAIKYTPDGGDIQVGVTVTDNRVIVSVKDNGLGISPEQQKLLFRRHVRLSRQEHVKIKGSGLGLFIVRSVAQRHGGDAWVESEPGKGSTFFFSVPLEGDNLLPINRPG